MEKDTENNSEGFDYEKFAAEEAAREAAEKEASLNKKETVSENLNAVDKRKEKKPKPEERSNLYDWVQCLVAALLICVLVFAFLIRIIGIVGNSMNPTFEDGDSVVISKLFYEPKQGDVVVLRKFNLDEPIIKRVVATEGQTVEIDFVKGIVYVDGQALDEPYIKEPTYTALDFNGSVTVPENSVFVMGDNRNDSLDSRLGIVGCVDERYIMGKVLFRLLPYNKFGSVY